MKIDTDLRLAIKAAVRLHNTTKCDWDAFHKEQAAAIKLVTAMPRHKKSIEKAKADLAAADAMRAKAYKVFENLGINSDLNNVRNEDKFKKAGGTVVTKNKTIDPDNVIAQIARADKKEAEAIIKQLGIKWE